MEHRLGHRVSTSEVVRLRTARGELNDAIVTDMSLSGAFVCSVARVPVLAPVYVSFAGDEHRSSSWSLVKAQVVRNAANGFGIEWWQFAPAPIMKRIAGRAALGSHNTQGETV